MDVPILSHFTLSASSPVAEKRSKKMTSTSLTAEEQAEFLAKDVLEYLLNDTGVRINGYRTVVPGQLRDVKEERPCIRRDDFQQARLSIIHGCNHIKLNHGQDIADLCQKLDIGDEQLHANFMEALDTVWEEPRNWGRLVSLFVAAYFICERLHREGSEDKIQSVIGWLGKYLKDHTVPWVLARGGFVSRCMDSAWLYVCVC